MNKALALFFTLLTLAPSAIVAFDGRPCAACVAANPEAQRTENLSEHGPVIAAAGCCSGGSLLLARLEGPGVPSRRIGKGEVRLAAIAGVVRPDPGAAPAAAFPLPVSAFSARPGPPSPHYLRTASLLL